MYNVDVIRKDFPILSRQVYGKPLVYLDNGATTQKPRTVVDAITEEYYSVNANVHRGVHYLSQEATKLHEASRERVRAFIGAASTNEIIFTRGTTEAIKADTEALEKALYELSSKLYQQPGAQGDQGGNPGAGGDDTVYDADFTDKTN